MKTNVNKLLTPTVAAASLLFLGSCGEDKETPTASNDPDNPANADLLIGEWELYSVDGEVYEENDTASYALSLKFDADGDFAFCYDYENKVEPSESYIDCYDGAWLWITKGEELTFSFESEGEDEDGNVVTEVEEINFKITKLTATELEGDWSEDGESVDYEVVLKKK